MGEKLQHGYDWSLLILYIVLVSFGWINLYAVDYEAGVNAIGLFNFYNSAGKQFFWIIGTVILFIFSLFFDTQFYRSLTYIFYILSLGMLFVTLLWGIKTGGHSSWLQWGRVQLQPTEFVKLTCALAVAKRLEKNNTKLTQFKTQISVLSLIFIPVFLILLQKDVGSALVFCIFILVLYREGFPSTSLIIGISTVIIFIFNLLLPTSYLIIGTFAVGFIIIGISKKNPKKIFLVCFIILSVICLIEISNTIINKTLKPYQRNRLKVLIDPNADPLGIGWNVMQSKIAIGSGGLWGKGFLNGSQTKYGFVPEQRKDFIFCTIGEEYGWIGSLFFISVFIALVLRIIYIAERQRLRFTRIYAYSVGCILFFHFFINVGMTIGLLPVIGIPLPFISYGGSSLWAFSMMLFILLKLDSERKQYASWKNMAIDYK